MRFRDEVIDYELHQSVMQYLCDAYMDEYLTPDDFKTLYDETLVRILEEEYWGVRATGFFFYCVYIRGSFKNLICWDGLDKKLLSV